MLRSILALLLLCTAGPLRAQASAQTGTPVIVCFGDSLTAGVGAPAGESYPDFLRKDLQDAGYHATVLNQGVGGETTKDGLSRVNDVLAAHPAIVVLELGANDGLRGLPPEGTAANLSTMIQQFQRAHIRVLLAGIQMPPNLGLQYVQQYDAIFPDLAKRYKVELIPWLLQGVYGVVGLMSPDYIHPNGEGYVHVAQTVLEALKPMLKK